MNNELEEDVEGSRGPVRDTVSEVGWRGLGKSMKDGRL